MKELETEWRKIPPARYQLYDFDGLIAPRDAETVIQIRFRAAAKPSPLDEMLPIDFAFVDPETRARWAKCTTRASASTPAISFSPAVRA